MVNIDIGTMINFTRDIRKHSLIYLETWLNLKVRPTEKSKINVVNGMSISLIVAYISGRFKGLKFREIPSNTDPTPVSYTHLRAHET